MLILDVIDFYCDSELYNELRFTMISENLEARIEVPTCVASAVDTQIGLTESVRLHPGKNRKYTLRERIK